MGSTSREVEVTVGSGMGAGSYFGNLLVVDKTPLRTDIPGLPPERLHAGAGRQRRRQRAGRRVLAVHRQSAGSCSPPTVGRVEGATGTTSALGPGGLGYLGRERPRHTGTDGGNLPASLRQMRRRWWWWRGGGSSGNGEFGNTYPAAQAATAATPAAVAVGGGAGGTKGGGGVGAPGCAWVFYRKKL